MTGILSENFELYGTDVNLLLQGRANQLGSDFGVGVPPDTRLLVPSFETLGRQWIAFLGRGARIRRSIPIAGVTGIGMTVGCYFDGLPSFDNKLWPIILFDAGNNIIGKVVVRPSGALQIRNAADAVIGETPAPVVKSNTIHKIDFQTVLNGGAGTAVLRVDNVVVLNLAALTNTGTVAQVGLGNNDSAAGATGNWYAKFYATWTLTGTYNTNFPSITGVQRLTGRADSLTGWTPRPRQKIGVGVLANRQFDLVGAAQSAALDCTSTAAFNIGSGDFTLESWVRFATLPTGSNAATIFGKWAQTSNNRSYRLVKYGPTANLGKLRFEISTDGTLAGVVTVADIVWTPEIGTYYNLAISRTAGVTRFFIDGVQQGANIVDANTYFAATAKFVMGNEFTGVNTTIAGGVAFDGHFDESRMTIGVGRYTANYTPTAVLYPRSVGGGDASFASVQFLIGCDLALADESTTAPKSVVAVGSGSARELPADAGAQYLTVNAPAPLDDRFLEASLIAATQVLTFTGQPANTETVTLGATVYTFNTVLGAANSILIGATLGDSIQNLIDAINAGPGIGTRYGTGTVINASAGSTLAPTAFQMTATAYTPGTAGNAIASTETVANASWGAVTLLGGLNIPTPSQLTLTPLDPRTTGIRWIELVDRSLISAGAGSQKKSLVVSAAVADGATNALTTSPAYWQDIIEQDPNTAAQVTPTTVLNGSIRLTRVS